jgi:assimilatory nitrate reductase catalytic subunit
MANAAPSPASVRTTCPYCGVGCGVVIQRNGKGAVTVKGDKHHPANAGKLCSKGSALAETLGLEDRLLAPLVNGAAAGWDETLQLIADRFTDTIARHGPESVALYVSGQLLTEDYYVANKLVKGFMGTANIDTNSRLCMASSVAGHKRAFGTDTVPGRYEDLELADTVVLVGSNLAWCHPVLYQRLAAAKAARPQMRVITIDPRRTATSELADLHLAIRPGTDTALFNGLLCEIVDQGCTDPRFVRDHVEGFDEALGAARSDHPLTSGLDPREIRDFYDLWTRNERVVTVYSQGVNQSSSGTDKVNAILNCHLASGRIGKPGMGPFSVTGQPNAMGGREVGGLANMLACHMDLENAEHRAAVCTFWQAPTIADTPGLKAVDMFRAAGDGRIKALWIIHTNPAVSMPDADAVRDAIAACDFVVVSDVTARTDTARLADVVLPAAGWGEKDGTVTNSERCISRQRPFLPAPGQARADWDILSEVGRRMGFGAAFDYASPAEIFREYAALSGLAGMLGLDFDIAALAGIGDAAYAGLEPVSWPVTANRTGGRFFGDGRFFTPSGRARMLPITHRPPAATPSPAWPLVLNTGRVRDHWHTMTRTAQSPRLNAHTAEPYLEIHPKDAAALGLEPAGLAEVESPNGRAILRVMISARVQPGHPFAPMHWTGETSSAGRVDALVAAVTDPVSGQPESKASVCRVRPFVAASYGFALSTAEPFSSARYWAKARAAGGWRMEMAWEIAPEDPVECARALFGLQPEDTPVVLSDAKRGQHRVAFLRDDRLVAALFLAPDPVQVSRQYMLGLLGTAGSSTVLAGKPSVDQPDPGATVCACFDVGINTIRRAITGQGVTTVEEIGAALNAGTNCGSCKPELRALLEAVAPPLAAQ